MHNFVLKFFEFLRSCVKFLKVIIMFSIMFFFLYWTQQLIGGIWGWFKPIAPFFEFFSEIGGYITSGSTKLFDAVFEYKYFVALLIFGLLYALLHFAYLGLLYFEEVYIDGRKMVRKFEEDRFNKKMEKENVEDQKKFKRYQIYISTFVKSKFAHREFNVDMEEQNKILVKHLLEKTGVCPEKFENGYLFTFDSFGQIDNNLDIFSKLFESTAPVDYLICVQVIGKNSSKEREQLKTLIRLKILNKITSFADTAYRYSFNDICYYETSQLGFFQKDSGTFEVHQFIRKN